MFPKPPRPEPPRRAVPTQVVRQREEDALQRRVPDTLIVERPAAPPDGPAPAPPAERPAV